MDDTYHHRYFPYHIPLRQPLHTAHGLWTHRQGIIVELTAASGALGRGEIAPLPWFGTESPEEAAAFCRHLGPVVNLKTLLNIPDSFPCCQFAFASALMSFNPPAFVPPPEEQYCQLLPTGPAALELVKNPHFQPTTLTYKWKIGLADFAQEKGWLDQLRAHLPPQAHFRLDANGSLSTASAQQWLNYGDRQGGIEFLEQPLAPQELGTMQSLASQFQTPLALDESVSSWQSLQKIHHQGWNGIYVLKVAILGNPRRLGSWLAQHPVERVYSSVLETPLGRQQVLQWLGRWGIGDRALGFGVDGWI